MFEEYILARAKDINEVYEYCKPFLFVLGASSYELLSLEHLVLGAGKIKEKLGNLRNKYL